MRRLLYIGLIFFFHSNLSAQNVEALIGFDITLSMSSLYGSSYLADLNNRTSCSGGLSFDFIINDQNSIRTGIYYDMKGATSDVYVGPTPSLIPNASDLILAYDYITFPALWTISTKGKSKLFFSVGPSFGYLLYQKWKVGATDNTPDITADNTSNTNKFDLGFTFSPGINFSLSDNLFLIVELRNNIGLLNTNKNSSYIEKTRMHSLIIGLRYK